MLTVSSSLGVTWSVVTKVLNFKALYAKGLHLAVTDFQKAATWKSMSRLPCMLVF